MISSLGGSVPSSSASSSPVPLNDEHKSLLASCGLKVGDRVLVNDTEGVIEYIGPVITKSRISKGIYVGVHLDEPKGKNQGVLEGVTYFQCRPCYGVFVRTRSVRPIGSPAPSGDDIKKLRDLPSTAGREDEERKAFQFWNAMDRLEESEALFTSKGIDLVDQEMTKNMSEEEASWQRVLDPHNSLSSSGSLSPKSSRSLSPMLSPVGSFDSMGIRRTSFFSRRASCVTIESLLEEPIDPNYKGPHYKGPDLQFALSLLDYYRENLDDQLPKKYAIDLMLKTEELLAKTVKSPVYSFEIPKKPDTQLIVVGDVHGQLNDVLWLFYKFGTPSSTRTYLFNGDIADRGRHAVEIFLVLFAFKVVLPDCVIINRGNHESADINEIYGFAQEVRSKYGNLIYQKFQDIFNLLPLCTVIEKRVLVVHGGLFREDGISLDDINKLNRKRPCPCSPETREDRMMFDLLWSDPRPEEGRGPSGRGVDCISFGPDVTERFLTDNQLDVCIRSHQVPTTLRGFEPVHDGRCVTLFSASNYCGTSGNYGGVIIFDPHLTFEIQEYMAPAMSEVREVYNETKIATAKVARSKAVKHAEEKAQWRTRRASIANMERDVINKMSRLICEHKDAIWNALWVKDTKKQGVLPEEIVKECLTESITQFGDTIPWSLLLKKLKIVDSNGLIKYENFLQRFRIEFRPTSAKHANWRFETIQQVFESIMKADLNLKETLMVFDRNCDGTVSYREFHELLSELNLDLSEPQVRLLMRIITAHYLSSSDEGQCRGDAVGRVDVAEFLGRFKVIYGHTVKDKTPEEDSWISEALTAIGRSILADRTEAAQRHYMAIENSPSPDDSSIKRRRSSTLRSAALFQKFKDYTAPEINEAGFLSYKTFINAIRQLPVQKIEQELGFKLDDDRLIRLARAVDITGSGKINYLEFLNAFYVVDSDATTNVAEEVWQQICVSFFEQKVALRHALSHFDPDATRKVDPDDFRAALTTLNAVLGPKQAPLTDEQVDLVVNSIDTDEDGMIDYEDFLESFVVLDVLAKRLDGSYSNDYGDLIDQAALAAAAVANYELRSQSQSSTPDSSEDEIQEGVLCDDDDDDDEKEDEEKMEVDHGSGVLLDYLQKKEVVDRPMKTVSTIKFPSREF